MHKIPMLFNRENHYAIPEINPAAAWVLEEDVIAHRKYDGTCMFYDGHKWFSRREVKPGTQIPPNFNEQEYDSITGKRFGWVPFEQATFAAHTREALEYRPFDCDVLDRRNGVYEPGTYELIGPRINGNPEGLRKHRLMPHARAEQLGAIQLELDLVESVEDLYYKLKQELFHLPIEGVVFKDRRQEKMAKLRRKDFNYSQEEEINARIQESQQRQRKAMPKLQDWEDYGGSTLGIPRPE